MIQFYFLFLFVMHMNLTHYKKNCLKADECMFGPQLDIQTKYINEGTWGIHLHRNTISCRPFWNDKIFMWVE